MRVLITGGCGFIGRNLVRHLLAAQDEVVVVDPKQADLPLSVHHIQSCIEDVSPESVGPLDGIVHLAAESGVAYSVSEPVASFLSNAHMTLAALEIARRLGCYAVLASSGAAVGSTYGALSEARVCRPTSPYGASKLALEGLLDAYRGSYGLAGAALRLSNVYGPFSEHKTTAVHAFVRNALHNRDLTIHGTGSKSRDFVFVEDVARVIRDCVATQTQGLYHVASGVETTVSQLASRVVTITGSQSNIVHLPDLPGEVETSHVDMTFAREHLVHSPTTGLDQGLGATVAWYRSL